MTDHTPPQADAIQDLAGSVNIDLGPAMIDQTLSQAGGMNIDLGLVTIDQTLSQAGGVSKGIGPATISSTLSQAGGVSKGLGPATISSTLSQAGGVSKGLGPATISSTLAHAGNVNRGIGLVTINKILSQAGGVSKGIGLLALSSTMVHAGGVGEPKTYIDLSVVKASRVSVRRSISDAMWQAEITVDGTFPLPSGPHHVVVELPDHTGTLHRVFDGILPGAQYVFRTPDNKTRLLCYDYGWYLARQYVPPAYEVTIESVNPSVEIMLLLGWWNMWETTTGIYPFDIHDVTGWGTTLQSKVFVFEPGTTKLQTIQAICEYCNCVFYIYWWQMNYGWVPAAWLSPEEDIDVNLPIGFATFTNPDPHIVSVGLGDRGEEKYNKVTVRGWDMDGVWYTGTAQTGDVTTGAIPVEYYERSGLHDTQAKCNARASLLLAMLNTSVYSLEVEIEWRTDLLLYGKIKFLGYTGVPEDWHRVTSIEYIQEPSDKGVRTYVRLSAMTDSHIANMRNIRRSLTDTVDETRAIVEDRLNQEPGVEAGAITSINVNEATITLERGGAITGRIVQ